MKRSRLRAKPKPSETDRVAAALWIRSVRGPCVMCGAPMSKGHHAIPQQVLERYAQEHGVDPQTILWNPDVGFPLCQTCHERHHSGARRVPRSKVPPVVFSFAAELDSRYPEGQEPMLMRLERSYPCA